MIRRQAVLNHRLEILVDLLKDFADAMRMKDPLAQSRAARQPVREITAHLFEFARQSAFLQFVFQ